MKSYKHLFFDLDRTLWDFERNSSETIKDLHTHFELQDRKAHNPNEFIEVYKKKNAELWKEYRHGKITKDELRAERFHQAFLHFEINDPQLALKFNDHYVEMCSSKPHLLPNTLEILEYLDDKYFLHIITNGFIEAQSVKMKSSGLENYFKEVIVSDGLGYRKPDKRIFHHAMKLADANQRNSIMIGDDYEADILGAKAIGMDQIYITNDRSTEQTATHIITDLIELKAIL